MRSAASSGVRLAELVATISLGTDLGLGQSMEHILRQTLVSLRMAELLAFDEADREVAYFSGLLAWVGCHTDAYEQAKWSGSGRSSPSAMFTASPPRRFLPFSASVPATAGAAASRTLAAERPAGMAPRHRGAGDGHINDEQRTPGLTVHCQEIVELVTDYLEGVLDPDMTAEVEAHLQLCDGCDTYVEQMRDTIRALGKVPVATLSEKARAELVRAFRDMRGPTAPA